MITFKKFLLTEDAEADAEIIKRDCGPFLSKIGDPTKNILWRGAKNNVVAVEKVGDNLYVKNVLKNRKPRDTAAEGHEALDDYVKKKFGINFRSESIMCSSSDSHAKEFGPLSAIIPIGDFDSLYSADISDVTEDIQQLIYNVTGMQDLHQYLSVRKEKDLFDLLDEEIVFKFNKDLDKINSYPRKTIEVMIHCDKCYVLPAPKKVDAMEILEKLK